MTVFFVDDGKAPCMLIIIDIDDGLFIYTILVTQKNEEKIKKNKEISTEWRHLKKHISNDS